MAYIRSSGGGIPSSLKTDMNDVLNKKLSTSTTYAPNEWADDVNLLGKLPERTASGTIAHFNDGADLVPLKSCEVTVTPSQSGTGDPSPVNPRPLNSFSSLTVEHTGANIFGGSVLKDGIVASMPSATVDTVNKTVTFASNATVNQRITDAYISGKFKENTQYTFILALAKTSETGSNLRIYYTDGTYTAIPNISTTDTKEIKTVVSTSGKTVNFLSKANQAGSTVVYYDECGVFEGSLTESDFAPYTPDPHTLALGSTVYGLTGDCVTGEFEETYKAVKISSLNWTAQSNLSRLYTADLQGLIDVNKLIVCEFAKGVPWDNVWSNIPLNSISVASSGNVFFKTTDYTTTEAFLEDWGNYYLCYPLATPTALTIDPVEIESFKGVNNIWCTQDNSSVAVEYRADIDLLITELGG